MVVINSPDIKLAKLNPIKIAKALNKIGKDIIKTGKKIINEESQYVVTPHPKQENFKQ